LNTSKIVIKGYTYKLPGWLFVSMALLLGACLPHSLTDPEDFSGGQGSQKPESLETQPPDTPQLSRETRPAPKMPERVPTDPVSPSAPVTGETPLELLEAIQSDLAARSGSASEEMHLIRDQAVTWSDGSLGCPQPGVFYTQAPVNGYWVVLQVEGKEYDYRASESRYFLLCEKGGLPSIQPPGSEPITR
jgi:hypothetical protein